MNINQEQLKKRISVSTQQSIADLVIKNGRIIDVFNGDVISGDVAISDGMIVGIGEYEGHKVIDAHNRYICPSFIDSHVHIESSMVPPSEFARIVLPHGVTTVIADPHEIANVSGVEGIKYMIEDSQDIPLDVYFMLPSCIPATPFENSGATLLAEDLEPLFTHERVLGLAEVMDYPSLRDGKHSLLKKIITTNQHRNHIDGHLAGLDHYAINAYRAAGIKTDHECNSVNDARERLSRGMFLLLREGSVAKDLSSLVKVVTPTNARRCMFCTDDKHLDDLINEGSIDHNVRLAIQEGLPPITAIQMASINTAECYGFNTKGAIAPGYEADFLLLDSLESISIDEVYKSGKLIAHDGNFVGDIQVNNKPKPVLTETIHIHDIQEEELQLPIHMDNKANIIEIIPNQLLTKKCVEPVNTKENKFLSSIKDDQLKIIVLERHKKTRNIGLGIVKGFGLTCGAIATTIAHDSHNIVATGTNDKDILKAVNHLKEINGGLVVVKNEEVIASLSLPISGLMSMKNHATIEEDLLVLKRSTAELGFNASFNPFLTLSFLTLPVIPELKLTDLGLFDVDSFQHIDV